MGIFLGAMGDLSPAVTIIQGREAPQAPALEQVGGWVGLQSILEGQD